MQPHQIIRPLIQLTSYLLCSHLTSEPDYSVEYTYDKNSNITHLNRHGHKRDNIYYGVIDNLIATYNGNQLQSTNDPEKGGFYYGTFEFDDSHKGGGTEYYYDLNGNLTQDYDKKISLIQYNSLNLPNCLQFNDGSTINYLYSADGQKCKVIHQTAISNIMVPMGSVLPLSPDQVLDSITTEYCGNVIYENDELSKVLTDEGYITFKGNIPTYHYYLRDHLGNNRIVVNQDGVVEEVNQYYPFGGVLSNVSGFWGVQAFKYGGKELDRMHGLDWYDFGSRFYRPDIPSWTSIDLLCEKYYSVSPYVYCLNNPMSKIDPDGQQVIPAPLPLPFYYHPYQSFNRYPSDQDIIRAINNGINGAKTVIKEDIVIFGAVAYFTMSQARQVISPEYENQRKRDRRNKENLDRNQANIAKSIDTNITGNMPNGDPAPKRDPNDNRGKTRTATWILTIGTSAASIKSVIDGSEPQEDSSQENDSMQSEMKAKEQENVWWNFLLNLIKMASK